ncbi:cytochrome C [Planktotalea sp.]|uniref:c-type cytochrome n=1 Tax=Planktotalea sp. TaxID=2029877 RepID=UPI0025E05CE3|nr:cytochrome C [Planktotalea sp.]
MKKLIATTLGVCLAAAPLFAGGHASGDAEAGENVMKKCKACHMIVSDDDTVIFKGGKTGPNLFGLNERQAGSLEGYKYGKSIVAAGEAGLVWNEADFVNYVADPKAFLRETLDDKKAKSKMAFKLKDAEDAANVWAFIVSAAE